MKTFVFCLILCHFVALCLKNLILLAPGGFEKSSKILLNIKDTDYKMDGPSEKTSPTKLSSADY